VRFLRSKAMGVWMHAVRLRSQAASAPFRTFVLQEFYVQRLLINENIDAIAKIQKSVSNHFPSIFIFLRNLGSTISKNFKALDWP